MKSFLHLLLFLSLSTSVAARPNRPLAADDDPEPPEPSSTGESGGGPELSPGPTQSADSSPSTSSCPTFSPSSPSSTSSATPKKQGPHDPPVPGKCVLTIGLVEHTPVGNHRRASVWLDIFDPEGNHLENLKWGSSKKLPISQAHPIEEGGVFVGNILPDNRGDSLNINWHHPKKNVLKRRRSTTATDKKDKSGHHGHHGYHGHDSNPQPDYTSYNTDDISTDSSDTYPETEPANTDEDPDTDDDAGDDDDVGVSAGEGGFLDFSYEYGPRDMEGRTFDWSDKEGDLRCLRGSLYDRPSVSKDSFRVNSCFFDCVLPGDSKSNNS